MPQNTRGSPRSVAEPDARPPKKLTTEELQKSVGRLTVVHERKQETEPLVRSAILNKEQMNVSVERLYSTAVDHKKQVMANLEARTIAPASRQVLDVETMTNSVQRIYSQAIQHKKDMTDKLKAKHISDPCRQKKLTKTDQQACNERAYTTPLQKKKDTEDHLVEKYIDSTVTKFKAGWPPCCELPPPDVRGCLARLAGMSVKKQRRKRVRDADTLLEEGQPVSNRRRGSNGDLTGPPPPPPASPAAAPEAGHHRHAHAPPAAPHSIPEARQFEPQAAVLVLDAVMRVTERALAHPYDSSCRTVCVEPGVPLQYFHVFRLETPDSSNVRLPFMVTPAEAHVLYLAARTHAAALLGAVMPASLRPSAEWAALLLAYTTNALEQGRDTLPLRNAKAARLWADGSEVLLAAGAEKSEATVALPRRAAALLQGLARVMRAAEPRAFAVHTIPAVPEGAAADVAPHVCGEVVVVMDIRLETLVQLARCLQGRHFFSGSTAQQGHGVVVRGAFANATETVKEELGGGCYALGVRLALGVPPIVAVSSDAPDLDLVLPPVCIACSVSPIAAGRAEVVASAPSAGLQLIGGSANCTPTGRRCIGIPMPQWPGESPAVLQTFAVEFAVPGYPLEEVAPVQAESR